MFNVFTYGSLMYPEIFEQVTGTRPSCVLAFADGWYRHGLRDRTYPGALPSKSQDSIEGVLWLDVGPDVLAALDRFEGHEYRRVQINVRRLNEVLTCADIYEWLLPDQTHGDWSPVHFERHHRQTFAQIHGAKRD